MSKLISGKEALIALSNNQEVEYFDEKLGEWVYMDMTHHFKRDFRLKPRTITINGVEYIDKQGAYEAFMEVYNEMDIHPNI